MIRVLNKKESTFILSNNYIGYLGYIFNDAPHIAPITYFYDPERNIVIGYSDHGHKIKALRINHNVCLEVACIDAIDHWESAQIKGVYKELFGNEAKSYLHDFSLGIKRLISEKEFRKLSFISEFSSDVSQDETPVIFKIEVEEITGRMRRKQD